MKRLLVALSLLLPAAAAGGEYTGTVRKTRDFKGQPRWLLVTRGKDAPVPLYHLAFDPETGLEKAVAGRKGSKVTVESDGVFWLGPLPYLFVRKVKP